MIIVNIIDPCGRDCKVCNPDIPIAIGIGRNEKMKKDSAGTMLEIREKTKAEHWIDDGN